MTVELATYATNAANIAGLVRVADVYGADGVIYTDAPRSWAAAVGAELHVRRVQMSPEDLTYYLTHLGGRALVVVELDARAVLLPHATFPADMVLVTGHEGGGVPGAVRDAADLLVELPQWGLVASQNVTCAATTVLYEYTRQYRVPERSAKSWRPWLAEEVR